MHRIVLLVLLVLLTACAQRVAPPTPGPDPDLGVGPVVSDEEPTPLASPEPTAAPASPAPADAADGTTAEASPAAEPTASERPVGSSPGPSSTAPPAQGSEPRVLLAAADRAGDHGARGPDWADLRALELVEVGNDLRLTIRLEGQLPSQPPEGEVPLIGVNIGDEGYQLFVEGGGQSWSAYLDTPDGFVAYPGTFELAGRAIVLQVPFSAVGSPTRAPVRAFVEWSRDSGTIGLLNPSSEDKLDGQPHTFDRNP